MSDSTVPLGTFRCEYFGPIDQYMAWHDGYEANFTCLDVLSAGEQAQAAAELLAALRAGRADARALLGLGHLHHADALPLLHDYLRRGAYGTYALQAIAQINPAGLDCPLVARQLATGTDWTKLLDLLVGLREYFTLPQLGTAIAARVFALLTHPEYLVRYHALATLRRLYDLQSAAMLGQQSTEALRADKLFSLITSDNAPRKFRQAQHLLRQQLPAELAATYPVD